MGTGRAALSSWVVPQAPCERGGMDVWVSGCLTAPPSLLCPTEAVLRPLLLDRAPAFLRWDREAALVRAVPSLVVPLS